MTDRTLKLNGILRTQYRINNVKKLKKYCKLGKEAVLYSKLCKYSVSCASIGIISKYI